MRCEFCGKLLLESDLTHGIRFGSVDLRADLFLPSRESAWTVICARCGEKLYRLIYSTLGSNQNRTHHSSISQYR